MKKRVLVSSAMPLVSIIALFMMLVVSSAYAENGYPKGYAEDRAQIKDLMSRYMFAMDLHDPERFVALFAENAKFMPKRGKPQLGRAAILKSAKERKKRTIAKLDAKEKDKVWPPAHRHFLGNLVLKVDGDKAYGNAYYGHYENSGDDRKAGGVNTGHYTDEFVKVNGRWFISSRTWDGTVKWLQTPKVLIKASEGSLNPTPPPY